MDVRVSTILLLILMPVLIFGDTEVLILARGGSKGVRLKNLQKVKNISLLARAIYTSKLSGLNVTVSTDNILIALEAINNRASVFHRSQITATDWAPSIWGVAEFISSKPQIKTIVLLQATSPFIKSKYLLSALSKLQDFDCVFSVVRSYKLRWKENNNGALSPINFRPSSRLRRQDWQGELIESGAFYITRRHLIEKGLLQNRNCTYVEVPVEHSLEIDTNYDLQVANALLTADLL